MEDAYTLDDEAKLNPGIAASGNTADASADGGPAANAEYKDINPDNLDLEAEKYVGKNVRFKTFYAGRDSSMPYSLAKFFPIEKYFRIISPSYSLANFYIIAEKTDANVQKVLSLNTTDEITISGQLLKILNSSDSATYYIKVDKIETDKAPVEEAETEDEGEIKPEKKKDDALVMPWNK